MFNNIDQALRFAYNYNARIFKPSTVYSLGTRISGGGSGLGGLDGAAQSGMIRAEVSTLPPLYEAITVARYASPSTLCFCKRPCCKGSQVNPEWITAVSLITDTIANAVDGARFNYNLRRRLVERYFGSDILIDTIAKQCNISRNTVTNYNSSIAKLLRIEETNTNQMVCNKLTDKILCATY
jgi:hypothetical protein